MKPIDPPRWPYYLAGGFGISLIFLGTIASVYILVRGAGLFAVVPMAASVAGVFIYQGAYGLLANRDEPGSDRSS
jgi:hypothetical protein